ncbi:MAG: hypothetical protein A2V69_00905 [Candidatus Portnoybacteria bacterium RBG_13_40_8]|uniref:Uncharacterized protein n=1 Tax=Candidatus Portnoybacteria bacterium RBG_13_40_8 TaxID=1801990 RepID=A0A1G2F3X1_9BACT|nr:MAG: hypothetical protein A2V69_00905 [Candidatus Portnoybacteria bacterium RBG_13_40_8]
MSPKEILIFTSKEQILFYYNYTPILIICQYRGVGNRTGLEPVWRLEKIKKGRLIGLANQ